MRLSWARAWNAAPSFMPAVVLSFALIGLSACGVEGEPMATPDETSRPVSLHPTAPSATPDAGLIAPVPDQVISQQVLPGLPCDVATVVGKHCLSCHGTDLAALMPLLSHADFLKPAVTAPERKVYELVRERTHDMRRPMPPISSRDALDSAELATLDAWIAKGAPQSNEQCTTDVSTNATKPIDLSECEVLEEVRAFGPGRTGKYTPPAVKDHYECFNFDVPWDGDLHGLRFDPMIDDKRIVHHWILFSTNSLAANGDNGCTFDRTYLNGWAPGPGAAPMPDGVGLVMPKKGARLQLEVHYNNIQNFPGVQDNSGVRICATSKLRPNPAAVHSLGSFGIVLPPGPSKVVNTCMVNLATSPVTVISAFPHMHSLGVHMKTEVLRTNGKIDILVDAPFDFRDQFDHPAPIVVQPGDRLRTTCSYDNTTGKVVVYGEASEEEMCLNFVTAYPAGGLGMVPGSTQCFGVL